MIIHLKSARKPASRASISSRSDAFALEDFDSLRFQQDKENGVFEADALKQERHRVDRPLCCVAVSFGPERFVLFRVSCPTVKNPAPRANTTSPAFTAIIGLPPCGSRQVSL